VTAELGDDDVAIDVEAVSATATGGPALVGRVTSAGERAAALLARRVLAGPIDPCGECDVCRRGGASVCARARPRRLARAMNRDARVVAAGRWVVALGDGLELPMPGAAAIAGDVALAYTMYARTGLAPHDAVVVAGRSPVARFLVEVLRAKAITPIVVADPADAAWCDWLLARGAAVARACGGDGDLRATVAAAIAAQDIGARPWRVIATAPDAIDVAAALAGPRATLTALAPAPALPGDLLAREVTLIGVAAPHPDLVVEVAAMCVKGEVDLAGGTTRDAGDATRTHVVASP
jgi:D-arabinose 1-dehydrogenase-like Zn-dependent alcohol dehydrogenase